MDTKNTDKAMQSFLNPLNITHYLITKRINFSIPGNQGMVLSILDTAGPMTLTEISALLSMSKQQLTPTINKLISMNYILKKRKENDGRSHHLLLTPAGKALIDAGKDKVKAFFSQELSQLPDHQQQVFYQSITSFNDVMSDILLNDKMKKRLNGDKYNHK